MSKATELAMPELNVELFDKQVMLLDELCRGITSKPARLLGVTPATWKRWLMGESFPKQGAWHFIIAMQTQAQIQSNRSSRYRQYRVDSRDVGKRLRELIHEYSELDADKILAASSPSEAKQYLLSLFQHTREIDTAILRRDNRFPPHVLRNAAHELGLRKKVSGFGEDKQTVWTLPPDPLDDVD